MHSEQKKPSRLLAPAAGLLVVLCLAWGANQWHLHALERELQAIADEKLAEFQADAPPTDGVTSRMAAKVVVAKPYVFWGAPAGKVSVFVGHPGEAGEEHIEGFEFFFAREPNASWTQTESGRCASDECTLEGKALLDALAARF